MRKAFATLVLMVGCLTVTTAASAPQPPQPDAGAHEQSFVTVSDGVRLEVLDYGGDGPPLIFVSGLGASGHAFDRFAPRFVTTHRVLAVTRRGFGASDHPPLSDQAYGSRRLGDDLLEIMDRLNIERAILAGWSAGGIELSSVASRQPQRVAGLVYLDAAYAYSFYAPGNLRPGAVNLDISVNDLRSRVRAARHLPMDQAIRAMDDILATVLPDIAADVAAWRGRLQYRIDHGQSPSVSAESDSYNIGDAIMQNVERFPALNVPILAIYAAPSTAPPPPGRAAANPKDYADVRARFQAAHPHARILELEDAGHDVFDTNPEQVEQAMRAFIAGLGS